MEPVWIIVVTAVATTIVVLLAILVVSVVTTLSELRQTARRVRELVDRVGPDVEVTAVNIRDVSAAAAHGAQSIERLAEGLSSLRLPAPSRTGTWALAAAAGTALFTMLRRRRARRNERNDRRR